MKIIKGLIIIFSISLFSACGFQLQKSQSFSKLASPLYISANDPYSDTAEDLKTILRNSGQKLVDDPSQAEYILEIKQDQNSQTLSSISSTQVRSYTLTVMINVQLRTQDGKILMPDTSFSEARSVITQSSSAMGNSSEIDSLYQSMRQSAVNSLLHRLNSREIENQLKQKHALSHVDHD